MILRLCKYQKVENASDIDVCGCWVITIQPLSKSDESAAFPLGTNQAMFWSVMQGCFVYSNISCACSVVLFLGELIVIDWK